jgi:hypothetical protein
VGGFSIIHWLILLIIVGVPLFVIWRLARRR